ncbi:hypothetical protein Pint_05295 [Pistacia integerrima]|uniref:Uncharacterized protein n=1 Tax=Pistacia integerrima TaxID=434235 RepID=A0ACC0Z395_9ROSI|nr:hypothetical protein Pint_05295 [Pistacia integerrima]
MAEDLDDVLQDVLSYGEKCLLIRLFTEKYYNKETFKGTMQKVWRTVLVWIRFSYERLQNFCYWCGLLGHIDKDYVQREHNSGEVQQPRVAGNDDVTAAGDVSPKADRSYNGVVETKMVTQLMALIITETRVDSQEETLPGKELHGSEGSGILQDPLQSYTLVNLSEDSKLLEDVGSQRILNEGGPCGSQQQVSSEAAMGYSLLSKPDVTSGHLTRESCNGRESRGNLRRMICVRLGRSPESCATKVGEEGMDAIPAEDDDLSAMAVEQHRQQP